MYALGSPWAILVVALAFLALRHLDVAWRATVAGLAAWGVGTGVSHGNLGMERILVSCDGAAAFDDLSTAGVHADA